MGTLDNATAPNRRRGSAPGPCLWVEEAGDQPVREAQRWVTRYRANPTYDPPRARALAVPEPGVHYGVEFEDCCSRDVGRPIKLERA
jgi:hypothetical protein